MTEWGLLESYMEHVPGAASPVSQEPALVEPEGLEFGEGAGDEEREEGDAAGPGGRDTPA